MSAKILQQINKLRDTPSHKGKERILRDNKDSLVFKKILRYTYDPYMRFHIRAIPSNVKGKGYREINHDTWVLLNRLSLRKLTGTAARETLFEHIESLTPSAATILCLVIRKDLKAGIAAKTINKIIPNLIPVFECQLVNSWDNSRVKWPILISPKIDGVRGEKRESSIFTRRGKQIIGVGHIRQYMSTVNPSLGASGELFIPGMEFRRASGLIRSNKPEKKNVHYAIFDLPYLTDMPLQHRLNKLSKMFHPLGTRPLPPVVYIPHMLVHSMEQVDKMYNYWRSRGYEGLVAKDPNSLVRMGRSHDWMRRVAGDSAEFQIIGVYESEERPGYLGGVVIEGGTKVGSGFVDSERLDYLKNPSKIIGRWATIEFKERTAAGSLRQPIYKAIRWDI